MNASSPNYFIVLCELYNPFIHGDDEHASGHFIVHSCYKNGYLFDNEEEVITNIAYETMHRIFFDEICQNWIQCKAHPFIRNYKNIIRNKKYFRPQIALCCYLPGGQLIAINKTFWIAIIQRKWKKIYAQRKKVIIQRAKPVALRLRELYGKWMNPNAAFDTPLLPGVKGLYYA
jgi:hypothetical protein